MDVESNAADATGWLSVLGSGTRVRDLVPPCFESYARILHSPHMEGTAGPGYRLDPVTSWSETARDIGVVVTAGTRWKDISGAYGEPAMTPRLGVVMAPDEGRLERDQFSHIGRYLASHSDGPLFVAVWTGWEPIGEAADLSRRGSGRKALVTIGGREYLVLQATPEELSGQAFFDDERFGWSAGNGLTPNYLWPSDRSWLVVTDIDLDSTVVAGSGEFIRGLFEVPDVEILLAEGSEELNSVS